MAPSTLSEAQLTILCLVAGESPSLAKFPEGYSCYSKKAWNVCLKNRWIERGADDKGTKDEARLTPLGRKELDKAGILYP